MEGSIMQVQKTGKPAALALALLSLAAPLVHAQEAMAEADAGIAVPYMVGGIGKSEAAIMRREGRNFDLRVEFSARKDNGFVADADLLVTDMSGAPVIALADAGPIVNVDLPRGRYIVSATWHGRTESQAINLNGKAGRDGKDLYFHWQGRPAGNAPIALSPAANRA
jgi:hypothetical protein